jgi:putative hydrolase
MESCPTFCYNDMVLSGLHLKKGQRENNVEIHDFHTHTFLSDGDLLPVELIRRAYVRGYKVIGVTDHVSDSNLERILEEISRDCRMASRNWGIQAIPGVELTHVPAADIDNMATRARKGGAKIIIVHGETPVEPVEPGTNRAALLSNEVDILAHPGLITEDEADCAAEKGIFLEISARRGHSLTNGHVAKIALRRGVSLLINSDGHAPGDLLDEDLIRKVGLGCGLEEDELEKVTVKNPLLLLKKIHLRVLGTRGEITVA